MAVDVLRDATQTVLVIPRTAQPTARPADADEGVDVRYFPRVRLLIRYYGTVTACSVRLWFYDRFFAAWYAGASTDELDPIPPTDAIPVGGPDGREWVVGIGEQVMAQIEKLEGGGEVEVYLRGVREAR